jgi:hypothetical protein
LTQLLILVHQLSVKQRRRLLMAALPDLQMFELASVGVEITGMVVSNAYVTRPCSFSFSFSFSSCFSVSFSFSLCLSV